MDGGSTATYIYSALNRRSESQTNGGSTIHDYFYNLNGQRSAIWDGPTRTLLQAQTYWGTTPVAYYSSSDSSIHYQHQDWQGTERARTAYNGTLESTYTSLPFGDGFRLSYGSSDTDPYHYAQLDHDSESDTQHAQFRQYSSTQGGWMSPDPYDGSYDFTDPQSFNRYAYVQNNPLRFTDQFGLEKCIVDGIETDRCPGGGGGGGGGFPIYTTGTCPSNTGDDGKTVYSPCYVFVGFTSFGSGAGARGGGGAPSSDPCANRALSATGTNIRNNIRQANTYVRAGAALGGLFNPAAAVIGALGAYGYLVNTGGPQDIKNLPQNRSVLNGPYSNAVVAGNVSYGVTCPFGAAFCQFAAGLAQTLGGNPNYGGTLKTGYDTPSDNAQIRQGQAMRAAGCHE